MNATTTEFKISIDERIRRDERLLREVKKATDYFIEQYEPRTPSDPPFVPEIEWSVTPGVLPPLWMHVHEKDELGDRVVGRGMLPGALADEVSRNVNMLKLWGELIDSRSDERICYLERLLREAEESEQGGASGNSN